MLYGRAMDAKTIIQLATLMSVMIGVVGLWVSVRAYRRQVNAQFLLQYTSRVDDIMHSMPRYIWAAHLVPSQDLPPPSEELTINMLRCFNFMSQMHFFCRKGYLPPSTWRASSALFTRMLQSPLFVREWHRLCEDLTLDPAFRRFVERAQRKAPAAPALTPAQLALRPKLD